MSKISCVLAGLALATAGSLGTGSLQTAQAESFAPMGFDYCYHQYSECMQDGFGDEYCKRQYEWCREYHD